MEWRCEWCEKPQPENDPPCDNCGHGSFERAIVPKADAGETATTTVWICPECGREHVKNSPPCSRCGNANLEMRELSADDYDVGAPGYRDLVTPRYAVGLVTALALAAVFVAGVTGIVEIPGLTPAELDVEDVPGNGTTASGLDLEAVESAYLSTVNDRRETADLEPLGQDGSLDEIATFYNQRRVKAEYGGNASAQEDLAAERLGEACSATPEAFGTTSENAPQMTSFDSPEQAGAALANGTGAASQQFPPEMAHITGVDVHVGPEGETYVFQIVC